jgi:hypothetical protein
MEKVMLETSNLTPVRYVGRITACKNTLPGLTAELQKAGYEIDICPDELIEDEDDRADLAFLEAYRTVAAADRDASTEMLYELDDIARRHGPGMGCDDVRPVPPGHVAHDYDTLAWSSTKTPWEDDGIKILTTTGGEWPRLLSAHLSKAFV